MTTKLPILATEKLCTGCLACMDVCSLNAISKYIGSDGHFYVRVDANICIGCLRCQNLCNQIHDGNYSSNKKVSIPYAVVAKDENLYACATSGGAFPTIAEFFLNKGGVVFGASYFEGLYVRHIGIEDENNLKLLQGSKYIQSDMSGVYLLIKKCLDRKRLVLFTGTGCQVAGVIAFFSKHKNRSFLYTMDIVCGGVPSRLLVNTFIEHEKPKVKSIAYFRKKAKYSFAYISDEGNVIKCEKSLPLDGFKSSLTNRFSCYNCEFVGIHRQSDWTIGDLWGDKEKRVCRSLCICHNEKSNSILKQLKFNKEILTSWNFVLKNPRLVNGKCPFYTRLERKYLVYIFNNFSYSVLKKIYASDVKKYDVFWMLYKVYRYLRFYCYFKGSVEIAKKEIK